MKQQEIALLKQKIDKASLVSFDIFDTLVFRKTNTPETIFDIVGKKFGIHGFRKMRINAQHEASRRAYAKCKAPHANMDEIYEVLSERTDIPVDWMTVKAYEIAAEKDALVPNKEMVEIIDYAKRQGKRVVATSDMYLFADTLRVFLDNCGFTQLDHIYCSADEHKAKFNRDLFERVAEKENIEYEKILHIGDKQRDDGEFPAAFGMDTFIYNNQADLKKLADSRCSDIDNGIYKILHSTEKGFWYNLGVEVGGPVYMGLYKYIVPKIKKENKKLFLLSRDGYNLYHILKNCGFDNIEYVYTSRRALTLASITEMNERDIASLPPSTFGQTVGEILDYLCINRDDIKHLEDAGFNSFEDTIKDDEDIDNFKKLYLLDKQVFLERCSLERKNAFSYFDSIGFFDEDALCFDCGWQASSQELIEQFKKSLDIKTKHHFIYFGIKNGQKSIRQVKGLHYDAYLFDFYKNYSIQEDLHYNVVMYELFFSAPHESVYYYSDNNEVVFEQGEGKVHNNDLLEGILAYINEAAEFSEKYEIEYSLEDTVGHLKRLIHFPTEEEAVTIGNISDVDGFSRKHDNEKYIAFVTEKQLKENKSTEVFWPKGLFKRPDISEEIKKECARRFGLKYPETESLYHLEDEVSIRNYHRWMIHQENKQTECVNIQNGPKFSVVIPVYNTVTEQLEECIESVLGQTYRNFELILVDDCSSWQNVVPVLKKYESHEHVKVIYRTTNGNISVATNDAISVASGDYIVFMDCDDTIEADALYEFAVKIKENSELDFIYSDEDKITEDGKIKHMPFFKPDWSPDLFLNMMYTNHLAAYRTAIVREVGGLRTEYNGSQDYDFTLRFMERSDNKRVGHVQKVLYHWRERRESVAFAMTSKNYASEAARYAKEDYIRRNNIDAYLECITGMSQYRIVYNVVGNPLVSIVIPSKDHPDILKQCIDSIYKYTSYNNYEIIVVDNGSNAANKTLIEKYLNDKNGTYIYEPDDFNFSKMCNLGAAAASGEYLLFLNDDIEIFQPQWLERMLGHAQQKHTGAVGAKLFYPESTKIQHSGVVNLPGGPQHSFLWLDDFYPYYCGWNRVDNNCIAVTGACLMLSADKFREVKGFDENLPVAYNDVKLCFELHRRGYYNVIRNDAVAYHHESLSRGSDQIEDTKLIRMNKERMKLYADFPELKDCDPYLNSNLHLMGAVLDLNLYYDRFTEIDVNGCEDERKGYIDSVFISDKIHIIGWSAVDGERHIEELDRYLVFKDPFGKTYGARVLPTQRADVVQALGDDCYLYAGFEGVLRKSDLRIDIMPYQMGVLTIDRNGQKHLSWCQEINVIRNPAPRPVALASRKLDDFSMTEKIDTAAWYLDKCESYEDFHYICGFAFVKNDVHYLYDKTLILRADNGDVYEYEVHPDERPDVTYSFSKEKFLYYTGFICYVFDNTLEKGRSYDIIIRLKNHFDENDICDIFTGKSILL